MSYLKFDGEWTEEVCPWHGIQEPCDKCKAMEEEIDDILDDID